MKALHSIAVLPFLTDHQKAQVVIAVQRGQRVRIRTTPKTNVTMVEVYKRIENWWGNGYWGWVDAPWANRPAAHAAQFNTKLAPYIVGKK